MTNSKVLAGLLLLFCVSGSMLFGMDLYHGTFIIKLNPVSNGTRQDLISCQGYILGLLLERRNGKLSLCSYNKARIPPPEWEGNDLILPVREDGKTTYVGLTWDVKHGKHLVAWREGESPTSVSRTTSYVQTDLDKSTSYKPTFGFHQTAQGEIGVYDGSRGGLKKLFGDDTFRSLDELKEKMLEFIKPGHNPPPDAGNPGQTSYFNEAINHYKAEQEINRGLGKLAQEKLQLLSRVKSDKQISQKEITKLQSIFREMGSVIQAKQAEKKAAAEKFAKLTRDFNVRTLMGGGLTADQKVAIEAEKKASALLNSAFEAANYRANEGLLILARNLNIAWDGLEKKLTALKEKQESILKIQKEMLTLMSNKVLQRIGDKRLHYLEGQLKQLMGEEGRLLAEIVKDFAMANKVYPPDARLKKEMTAVLQDRQRLQKTIVENNGKIEEFFKETADDHRDRAKDETPDGNRAHLPSVVTREAVTESGNGDAVGSVTGASPDQGQDPSPSASGIDSAY